MRGVLAILFGLAALFMPGIALWAVFTGILEIVAAIRLRREITNEWMLGFSGFVSIALGVLLFFQPAAYALIFGAIWVGLGVRLRQWTGAGNRRDALRPTL